MKKDLRNKIYLSSLVILSFVQACSIPSQKHNDDKQFNTLALTPSYIERIIIDAMSKSDQGLILTKEIGRGIKSYSTTLKSVIRNNNYIRDNIRNNYPILENKISSDPIFANFFSAFIVSEQFNVNSFTTGLQYESDVAVDNNGNFVITWMGAGLVDSTGIYAQRYNSNGVAQGTEFLVNTFTTSIQSKPSIAVDNNGNFVITWNSANQDGSLYGIYAQRYNSNGIAQGTEFRINTTTGDNQKNPSLAVDSNGNFTVAWESYNQDGFRWGIYAQRYNSNGVRQGSEFLVNTFTNLNQINSSIAMDSDGDFVITWQSALGISELNQSTQDGSGWGIYAQKFNPLGQKQGSEFRVNSFTTNNQFEPSVAMNSIGNFIITWASQSQDGSGLGVYAQRYNSNGESQGSEFLVNSYTTSEQYQPSIAMNSTGDFTITFTSAIRDGSGTSIYAQRFNSDGNLIDSDFRVNSTIAYDQLYPSVGMDSDGDFVITFSSSNQSSNNYDVYGRKYTIN
jgi:hypothetical protein